MTPEKPTLAVDSPRFRTTDSPAVRTLLKLYREKIETLETDRDNLAAALEEAAADVDRLEAKCADHARAREALDGMVKSRDAALETLRRFRAHDTGQLRAQAETLRTLRADRDALREVVREYGVATGLDAGSLKPHVSGRAAASIDAMIAAVRCG